MSDLDLPPELTETEPLAPSSAREWMVTRVEHGLSALMLAATRIRFRPWKNWQIRWFVERYQVNLAEAVEREPERYPDFNTFFTRTLKPGERSWPAGAGVLAAAADGALSACGTTRGGEVIEAKGACYTVEALLGERSAFADRLAGGFQYTIYLAPRNYHRVHMPLEGRLVGVNYIPGRLFSVNPRTVAKVPDLFARNERVVSLFETDLGAMAVVMVGAVFVGAMAHVCGGMITPPRSRTVKRWRYGPDNDNAGPMLAMGSELGCFHMGSTVVVLVENGALEVDPRWATAGPIEVGAAIATGA